jgi:hypothetical protein
MKEFARIQEQALSLDTFDRFNLFLNVAVLIFLWVRFVITTKVKR